MRFTFLLGGILMPFTMVVFAQPEAKLGAAYRSFLAHPAMKYASSGLLVIETSTGKTVFSSSEQVGLAPASTLKVVTAATALDVLGKNFVFKTPVWWVEDKSRNDAAGGTLIIEGSGDPTLGSWRYASTRQFVQLTQLLHMLHQSGAKAVGSVMIPTGTFGTQLAPGGWTFDDMGNYYGAGAGGFNWHENQYDLVLKPGKKTGDPVEIAGTQPIANAVSLFNELATGPVGSGDRAIIYPDAWPGGTVRGTVPAGVNTFTISGSVANPKDFFLKGLQQAATRQGLQLDGWQEKAYVKPKDAKMVLQWQSPSLDSIVYFFLQKSINLYGEALIKQLALQKGLPATTDEGVSLVRNYWEGKGVDKGALRMADGSGLSPHNRITVRALVEVLQYARRQPWYPAFYEGLPVINGIKMKSGSIKGVRGYTGYVTASSGITYTFAFLVNNFEGSSSAIMQQMFTVLNTLK